MIYPSADKIDEQVDSKYALVILAAKRAKLLKEGGRPLIPTDSTNSLTVALEEIAAGSIRYQFDETSLAGQEALADQEAVVGKREIEVEGIAALPLPSEMYARAASELGADLKDTLDDDDLEDEVFVGEETEEEEDDSPIPFADEEEEEV
jgi:DNA-directed RNA polymerase subunit omega